MQTLDRHFSRLLVRMGINYLSYLFSVAAGIANPVQAGASAQLNKNLNSPLWTAMFVYLSGLVGVLLIQGIVRQAWPGQRLWTDSIPWWAWTGGLLSIASTITGLTLAQKMGSGLFTGLSLTASIVSSVVLDSFGLAGFKPHPLSSLRVGGVAFLIAGVWMVAKS